MVSRRQPIWVLITVMAAVIGSLAGVCTVIQFFRSNVTILPTEPNDPSPKPTPSPPSNLQGSWWIYNTISKTTHARYFGLKVGYKVFIRMTGSNNFEGTGEKWTENGKEVTGRAHTPIRIKGSVEANTISALFWEEGTQRGTTGRFHWTRSDTDETWIGEFSSTAASSSGPSVLSRNKNGT